MPLPLYDLPNWPLGMLVCGGWVVIGLGGYVVFHRVCRVNFAEGEKNLAMALLGVVATVNSLLLAFSAVSAWEAFGSADRAVHGEATQVRHPQPLFCSSRGRRRPTDQALAV